MIRSASVSLGLGLALAACGGGGGGGDSSPAVVAPPSTTALAFDNTNYAAASTEAVSSALFLLDTPSFAVAVENSDVYQGVRFGLAQVPSLGSWFKGAPVAVGVVESTSANCAVSGTITASATDADGNGIFGAGDSVSIAATNCSNDVNSVINGAMAFTIGTLSGDLNTDFYDASITLTFNNLKVTTGANSVTANGELTLSTSANGAYVQRQSISATSLTVNATYGSASHTRSLGNFNATLTMAPNLPVSTYKTTSTVSGTVSSSALDNKSVTIATAVPFVRLSTDAYPSSGQGTLTGSTAAKVRMTAQNATSVLLELDSNGDGAYETSSTKSWAELR